MVPTRGLLENADFSQGRVIHLLDKPKAMLAGYILVRERRATAGVSHLIIL